MKNKKNIIIIICIILGIFLIFSVIIIYKNLAENKTVNLPVNNVKNPEIEKIEKEIESLEKEINKLQNESKEPMVKENEIVDSNKYLEQINSIQKKLNELKIKKQDIIHQEQLEKNVEVTENESVFYNVAQKIKENINN